MRFKQFAAASAAAGLVVLGGATAAQAASSGNVSVQPGSVAPGGQVSVYGLSCTATTGTATSSAFSAPISLAMLANSTGGVGNVSASAKPGTYPVTVTCGSMKLTGSITVTGSGTVIPHGGAKTGDGASLVGSGTNEAAGLALVAGALGVGAFALRRKAKSER